MAARLASMAAARRFLVVEARRPWQQQFHLSSNHVTPMTTAALERQTKNRGRAQQQ
ncbi:uncharacterized protein DS421_12g354990 [Arachis hypogaea]|nr:uncharacterized protein DS421_12g354990 [Arachis hypogaea]